MISFRLRNMCLLLTGTMVPLAAAVAKVEPDVSRFFADGRPVAECARRLAYADGAYARHDEAAGHNLEAMLESRADLDREIRNWSPSGPGPFLEIGPLLQPALRPDSGANIAYWDVDVATLIEIERWASGPNSGRVQPMYADLARMTPEYRASFLEWNERFLTAVDPATPKFRAVVISQVFNYVAYRDVLRLAASLQKRGGLVFITNRVDHGDDEFFHSARPRRDTDIDAALKATGYEIIRRVPKTPDAREHGQVTWVGRLK